MRMRTNMELFGFSVWLLCLSSLVKRGGGAMPVFKPSPRNVTHRSGKDVHLTCTVDNLGRRTIIWRKISDPYPISVGHTKFTPSKKYRVTYDKQTGMWTLAIKNVQRHDAGEYECRVTGQGSYSKTVSLIMPGDGHPYFEPLSAEVMVGVGETAVLPCVVNNLGKNLVLWRDQMGDVISVRKKIYLGDKRFKVIREKGNNWDLQIRNVKEKDFGPYICMVNTDPVITRTVLLKSNAPLKRAPEIIKDAMLKTIKIKKGKSVTLTCKIAGVPTPKVTWFRRVTRYGKNVKEDLPNVKGPTLTLKSVTLQDTGNYVCTGRNGVPPSARWRFKLFVEPVPTTLPPTVRPTTPLVPTGPMIPHVTPVNERVGQRKGSNAVLECIAIGLPLPSIQWRRHGALINDDWKHRLKNTKRNEHTQHSELTIRSVLAEHFGDYECYAINYMGTKSRFINLYEVQS